MPKIFTQPVIDRLLRSGTIVQRDGKYFYGKKQVVPRDQINTVIQEYYNNPRYSAGRDRLHEFIARDCIGVSAEAVNAFLKNNLTHQLFEPVPRRNTVRRIIPQGPHKIVQIDLIDMQDLKSDNNGYRYCLTFIDLFSKYAMAAPLKDKYQKTVVAAMAQLLDKYGKLSVCQTDRGAEFQSQMKKMLADRGIKLIHSSPYNPSSQGAIERYNRELKTLLFRAMNRAQSNNWVDFLPQVVANHNSATHGITKYTPDEIQSGRMTQVQLEEIRENIVRNTHTLKIEPSLAVGDHVRILLTTDSTVRKNKFRKRIKQNWSNTIFKIRSISPGDINTRPQYLLFNPESNRNWRKKFWAYQLQKVDPTQLNYTPPEHKEPPVEVEEEPIEQKMEEPIAPPARRSARTWKPTAKVLENIATK